jgi:proline dehydrogenase
MKSVILAASRNSRFKQIVASAPITRGVVKRYIPGEGADDAVEVTRRLVADGLQVSLDHLGEDTTDQEQAAAAAKAYLAILERLSDEGLTPAAEVSLKLSAVGQALPGDGERIALDHAHLVCAAAERAGTTVTLDMEDHTTTDSTLRILHEVRRDFPSTGAVVQSYLRRTESDCRDLATAGSRVRLCKGAYDEPESVAFQDRQEVDLSYVRCLSVLMAGAGYPMVATHDPRLVAIAADLVSKHERKPDSYEFQMLYGIRPNEQRRLVGEGNTVRVYLPYGTDWYGYFMRRLAERPANVAFFLRSLATRS